MNQVITRIYRARMSYLFILPAMTVFTVFFVYPLFYTIYISLNLWLQIRSPVFVGLENYGEVFRDPGFWNAMKNTIYYSLMVVAPVVVCALVLAVLVNNQRFLQNFFKSLFYIPFISSNIVIAVVWRWIYQYEHGILNYFLGLFGIQGPLWLSNVHTALPAISIVGIWRTIGYYMVIYLAGLQSIPSELYEAATIDGSSKPKSFLYITLPMLRPITLIVIILATINAFQVFGTIYIMTSGGPVEATTTAVWKIYHASFVQFRPGYGAVLGFVLFIVILVIALAQMRYFREEAFGARRTLTGNTRSQK